MLVGCQTQEPVKSEVVETSQPSANTTPALDVREQPSEANKKEPDAEGPPLSNEDPPLRVALYLSPGVAKDAHDATVTLLSNTTGIALKVVKPRDVQRGVLKDFDVVLFTGGSGSVQGRFLAARGRSQVRDFVKRGGGYVGICAGAYLALQGEAEFHKLAIVAGKNKYGDNWRRGVATVKVEDDTKENHFLHYANGPIFAPVKVDGLPNYQSLATFRADVFRNKFNTHRGEMPGTPAIIRSRYGKGNILLFSPNPVLDGPKADARPDMLIDALRWVHRGQQDAHFKQIFVASDSAPVPKEASQRN